MSDTKIQQVCGALSRLYEFVGADPPYAQQFSIFCDDNDFDDDSLRQELQDQETVIIEFDPNFPIDDRKEVPEDMDRHILTILNLCAANPERSWDIRIPRFDIAKTYELDLQFMNRFKKIFRAQCPRLWTSELENDATYCQILAIGYKNRFDYIQLLIDDFTRSRVENCGLYPNWSPSDWLKEHKHFYQLYNIRWTDRTMKFLQHQYDITDIEKLPTAYDLVKTSVELYDQRTHPQMSFLCYKKINTDIEIISKYIYATINMMVKSIIEEAQKINKCVCPFQFDVTFATGKPHKVDIKQMNNDNLIDNDDGKNDNSDDDDDDEKHDPETDVFYMDCVGDITAKLKNNNLRFVCKDNPQNGYENRVFIELFNKFKRENKCDYDVNDEFMYPYGQRLCAFVDRREAEINNNNDTVYFYEPPEDCKNIPNGVIPEWYINATKTCLLPGMNYMEELKKRREEEKKNKEKNENEDYKENIKDKVKKDNKDKVKKEKEKFDDINTNIDSSFHCYGQLLTFSVHVKQEDEIKIYCYYNGGIIRFLPKNDIRKILPKIFNMKWKDSKNQYWFENDLVIYDQMDEMDIFLADKSMHQFKKEYKKWKDWDDNDYY